MIDDARVTEYAVQEAIIWFCKMETGANMHVYIMCLCLTASSDPCARGGRIRKGFFISSIRLYEGIKSFLLPFVLNANSDTISKYRLFIHYSHSCDIKTLDVLLRLLCGNNLFKSQVKQYK